ncbi:MAG: hypothetical protein ACPL8I_15640, partial [Chloroflexaceae bacterium]
MHTIQQLRQAVSQHPEVRETLELHIALLEVRARVNPPAPPPLPFDVAEGCLARGEPLLDAVTLTPDWSDLARVFSQICAVAAAHRPAEADAFHALAGMADDLEELREGVAEHLANTAHPARR